MTGIFLDADCQQDIGSSPDCKTYQDAETKAFELINTSEDSLLGSIHKVVASSEGTNPLEVIEIGTKRLSTPEDADLLPNTTPASFVEFIKSQLVDTTQEIDGNSCISFYDIKYIGNLNVAGGAGATLAEPSGQPNEDLACGGGAPLAWVLLPDGNWEEMSLNGASCDSESGGKSYSEFNANCFNRNGLFVANPNGSMVEASL